jgi:ornithine cyclodeaminase
LRPIAQVRVFGRNAERCAQFARALEPELKIETRPANTAQACVEGANVVVTITKSAEPVCRLAGANTAARRELDSATVLRAAVRVTDDRAQARAEAAEFRDLASAGQLSWDDVRELGDLVTGKVPGFRSQSAVTLFKSRAGGCRLRRAGPPARARGRRGASDPGRGRINLARVRATPKATQLLLSSGMSRSGGMRYSNT